jgi:hypothetical protein
MIIDTREGFKAYLNANRFYNADGSVKPLSQIEAELHHSVTRATILAWLAELAPATHAALIAATPEAEMPVEAKPVKMAAE